MKPTYSLKWLPSEEFSRRMAIPPGRPIERLAGGGGGNGGARKEAESHQHSLSTIYMYVEYPQTGPQKTGAVRGRNHASVDAQHMQLLPLYAVPGSVFRCESE
jgi:hypothetical protein